MFQRILNISCLEDNCGYVADAVADAASFLKLPAVAFSAIACATALAVCWNSAVGIIRFRISWSRSFGSMPFNSMPRISCGARGGHAEREPRPARRRAEGARVREQRAGVPD